MVFESITSPIFGALDGLLNPIIQVLGPMLFIMVVAIILAFVITIANKLLVDQDRLQYLQKEMKVFQQEMNEARKSNDPKALEKMQKKQMEFMDIQKEMMKDPSFKGCEMNSMKLFMDDSEVTVSFTKKDIYYLMLKIS